MNLHIKDEERNIFFAFDISFFNMLVILHAMAVFVKNP